MCIGAKSTPEALFIAMGYIKCDFSGHDNFNGRNKYFKPWNTYDASKACKDCYCDIVKGQAFVDG